MASGKKLVKPPSVRSAIATSGASPKKYRSVHGSFCSWFFHRSDRHFGAAKGGTPGGTSAWNPKYTLFSSHLTHQRPIMWQTNRWTNSGHLGSIGGLLPSHPAPFSPTPRPLRNRRSTGSEAVGLGRPREDLGELKGGGASDRARPSGRARGEHSRRKGARWLGLVATKSKAGEPEKKQHMCCWGWS